MGAPLSSEWAPPKLGSLLSSCTQLALVKDLNGKPDMKAIKADWEADSNGRLEMNYAMFYNAIFELVDLWCEVARPSFRNTHPYLCSLWGWLSRSRPPASCRAVLSLTACPPPSS